MAKPEWGLKRTCLGCGARFYDMQRDPIVCPKCETEFDPLALVRPRRARAAAQSQSKAKAAPAPAAEETEAPAAESEDIPLGDDLAPDLDLGEEESDDVIEEADDMDAEDPDVSDVLDGAQDDDEDT